MEGFRKNLMSSVGMKATLTLFSLVGKKVITHNSFIPCVYFDQLKSINIGLEDMQGNNLALC